MGIRRSIGLGGRATLLAVTAVAVALALSACGGSSAPTEVRSSADVNRMLEGVPQQGMTLGEPNALVTLIEFGDLLECQTCRTYAVKVLPQIVANQVRDGEARLSFSNYTASGVQSKAAAAAAVAAGEQGRGWNFIELFYLKQAGAAQVTDEALTAVARQAGVPNMTRWNRERKGERVAQIVEATTAKAESLGFSEPPGFAALGPANYDEFREPLKPNGKAKQLETAIAETAVNRYAEEEE